MYVCIYERESERKKEWEREHYPALEKKKTLQYETIWIDLKDVKYNMTVTEERILHNSTYVSYLK
jgi:hypothetical protein